MICEGGGRLEPGYEQTSCQIAPMTRRTIAGGRSLSAAKVIQARDFEKLGWRAEGKATIVAGAAAATTAGAAFGGVSWRAASDMDHATCLMARLAR
jgi:hypothetical protein